MRTNTGDAIHHILRVHVGQEQAISAPDICRALRWPAPRERHVRRLIADESALWPDVVVCATPGQGYFCAASLDEIQRYDNWLSGLARDAADKHAAFRAAALTQGFRLEPLPSLATAA